ncbi:MAG: T9SS type A sorting domain-containing protein [Dysgonamonadaceae bacterium]|jgi:hypothetical protein|nr:T9SS type A sorting domain-containing protein [Dysgonamonadaceae bacterium]
MKSKNINLTSFCILTGLFIHFCSSAQITWSEGQLLPTFPESAKTQDLIYLNNNSDAEMYLFSSMKGLVNRTQPRIFSYEGDAFAEGAYTWLNSLSIKYKEATPWDVLTKYKSEISGLIVYDTEQIHTVNLATRLAKDYNALIASPELLNRLTSEPYNFPILLDLRGQFTGSLEIYQYIFDNYWENTDKRILIGLSPDFHKGSLREYAVALGAAVIWLDPQKNSKNNNENALLNKFLASMPKGANYMGWWSEEQPGVTRVSNYGFTTIASDYSTNLTFHSGMPRLIDPKPMPPKPELKNKIYVAFIISDGDNLQYVEHLMRKLWSNSDRGKTPIGWTLSPAMVDAMPGALNYYHQSATENDNLISGPSGYGYTYPNNWLSSSLLHDYPDALADFVAKTEEYNVAAGLRVITVWNTITGGINRSTGNIYADNAPTLLGLTAQNTGGAQVIYNNTLPGKPLSCNYCTNEQAMKEHIASASAGWNGDSPRFLIIQAQPWNNVTPTSFKNVANSLDDNYIVVRPDHIFQLIREAAGLPVNPGAVNGDGDGLYGTYYNGVNFDEKISERIDNVIDFDWGNESPTAGVNVDSFTVRWEGKIQPPFTGHYAFYVTADGVRLWVNNELIIDKLQGTNNPATYKGKIYSLAAGEKYDIKLEYLEKSGVAQCKLEWASAFLAREVVPQSQLYKERPVSIVNPGNTVSNLKVFKSNDVLNVEISDYDNSDIALSIYTLCGKNVLRQNIRAAKTQIDINSLSRGVYMINICTKNDSKTIKFLR